MPTYVDTFLEKTYYIPSMENINRQFNYELQQQIEGKLPKGHIYKLGYPGKILLSAGVPDLTHNGKNFLVGLSLNPTIKGKKLEINDIRSIFPKDTQEWINWIEQGKGLYFDKMRVNKVLNILDQQQINPADVAFGLLAERAQQGGSKPKLILSHNNIESIINIVNNFANVK
ncbi:MAG: hypothetical protein FWC26_08545 [Fibromonadales bacterium]|nr:hypothetical protein [Fibromonadales bacterium]